MNENFIKKVQNYIFHSKLLQKGDGIVIGISGGPDSVALTRIFVELQKKYDLKLSLLHVNYGLRGRDSDLDEELVRKLAVDFEIPLKIVNYEKQPSGNLEQELRDFRYREFEKERETRKFQWIAVGHTKDDLVETVLMNIIRGAGLKGARGIKPKRGKIIRPLLWSEKSQILEYLDKIDQKHRMDESNFDQSLLRNKIRSKLVPALKKEYNSNITQTIANFADNLGKIENVVDEYTEKTYNDIATEEKEKIVLSVGKLKDISTELRSMVFRRAVNQLKGDVRNLESSHFFEFEKVLQSKKGKAQRIEILGLQILRKSNTIEFLVNK